LHVPGAFYHVTLRGNHRQDIFFRPAHRRLLEGFIVDAIEHTHMRIHAYCWMTNHIHLLIQVADVPLGAFMQRIGTRYARTVQRSIPTTGHLFENRYHALLIDVDNYFLELLRYIHLNPVRAGIVDAPQQYRWSSHRVYLGTHPRSWVHSEFGLSLFNPEATRARTLYAQFVQDKIHAARDPTLFQGHPEEPRVLGHDRFLQKLQITSFRSKPKRTLPTITDQICRELNVTLPALRSPVRTRALTNARGRIAAEALEGHAATLSEIARFLNRHASAVARSAARYRKSSTH
jgi:REP element-mobilizing transposase RayT